MIVSNNITRLLQARGISFTIHELPPEKLSAVEVAKLLNVEPDRVYKTIVVKRMSGKNHILAVVPGPHQVDLKAVARLVEEKKVRLPTQREAEGLTRLKSGGISPLALLHRPFTVLVDISAMNFSKILISGGQRGLDIALSPTDLIALTGAIAGEISRPAD